ncbi:MAG: phosphoribosyltransferase family protein [Dehalococcoidales bacterium]
MVAYRVNPVFESRFDAGSKLAEKLGDYRGQGVVVLAIPNGGLPVAMQVALALDADLDVVISRKLPIPLRPEGGFGAIADDGTVILNEDVLNEVGLTEKQINYQVGMVRTEIRQRSLLYRGSKPLSIAGGKIAIIIDDGLASGYTMMAAVESVRRRRPASIVVAVPAASQASIDRLAEVADRVVTVATGGFSRFYIADYYRYWHSLSDEEGLKCLREYRMRRFAPSIEPVPDDRRETC